MADFDEAAYLRSVLEATSRTLAQEIGLRREAEADVAELRHALILSMDEIEELLARQADAYEQGWQDAMRQSNVPDSR